MLDFMRGAVIPLKRILGVDHRGVRRHQPRYQPRRAARHRPWR